jgi:hypothetical protein
MSTDDKNNPVERFDLEELMDPPLPIYREEGRCRCSCGRFYSREIVVIACAARGHQPNPNPQLKDK